MPNRILTSHVGSLPRSERLIELNVAENEGRVDEEGFQQGLTEAVAEVVAAQRELGIDIVSDGEYGHLMDRRYDFGAWWRYVFARLSGLELVDSAITQVPMARAKSGEVTLSSFAERRDWQLFKEAYADPASGCALPKPPPIAPVCRGPVTYRGQNDVARDIRNLKAALDGVEGVRGFLTAVAPASASRFSNEYYNDDVELMYACADALREEYSTIVEAGLIVQLDDPALAENWDQINPAPSIEAYRRFTMTRIEALNHAIRGLPPEQLRLHICWGSWHGPHTTDLPLADIIDLLLQVNVGSYSFEAANARHEHEWRIWEHVSLPEGKVLVPGVVTHSTNVVEHPELVAERILRFAELVGPENVIASTDCGLGGRVHPQVAWAKLRSLVDGAELASARLGRAAARSG